MGMTHTPDATVKIVNGIEMFWSNLLQSWVTIPDRYDENEADEDGRC